MLFLHHSACSECEFRGYDSAQFMDTSFAFTLSIFPLHSHHEMSFDYPMDEPSEYGTDPTASPTMAYALTVSPSKSPTAWPTVSPSASPTTAVPSTSPTTPAPIHPGEKICGDHFNGTYNGVPMNVEVRMPHDGDMTMDCSACDFDVTDITAYDSDGNELTDGNLAAESLAVYDLVHGGDYTFIIEGVFTVNLQIISIQVIVFLFSKQKCF